MPGAASILAYNPLVIDVGDGLLISDVAVTEQNVAFPNAREVGVLAYGLNKRIGEIDFVNSEVILKIPAGKMSFRVGRFGIPLPAAISTECFTTGTSRKGPTRFQFEIRSWLRPAFINKMDIEPDGGDTDGLLGLLKEGHIVGGFDGKRAQAILGKPIDIC